MDTTCRFNLFQVGLRLVSVLRLKPRVRKTPRRQFNPVVPKRFLIA